MPGVRRVVVVDSVGSTNDLARELGDRAGESGVLVVADRQVAGRGRAGRRWESPPRLGLYLSWFLRPRCELGEAPKFSLAAAVGTAEAIVRATGAACGVKWPNDIVRDGRKIAGILVETRSGGDAWDLVVGIGVNVNHSAEDFPEALRDLAGSIRLARGGVEADRTALGAEIVRRVADRFAAIERGLWDHVANDWMRLAPAAVGARVWIRASDPSGRASGVTDGLDPSGALRVRAENGSIVLVRQPDSVTWSGE